MRDFSNWLVRQIVWGIILVGITWLVDERLPVDDIDINATAVGLVLLTITALEYLLTSSGNKATNMSAFWVIVWGRTAIRIISAQVVYIEARLIGEGEVVIKDPKLTIITTLVAIAITMWVIAKLVNFLRLSLSRQEHRKEAGREPPSFLGWIGEQPRPLPPKNPKIPPHITPPEAGVSVEFNTNFHNQV